MPLLIVLSAIASRKKRRPVPGHPSGKLEKSLCSRCLLRAQRRPRKRLASFAADWTPRSSAFWGATCRFFGYSGVWVKLEMYDSASNSDSDGLGAIACTEFFHNVLNMSL